MDMDAGPIGSPSRLTATPRSFASALEPGSPAGDSRPRSLFGGSYAPSQLTARTLSSKTSRARSFAQRENSNLGDDLAASDRETNWEEQAVSRTWEDKWNQEYVALGPADGGGGDAKL